MRGRKRDSIQLSPPGVSMVMAPEAGQNFLSGNKQQLPFTNTQACWPHRLLVQAAPGRDRGLRSPSSVTCSRDRREWRGDGETASEGQSQGTLGRKDPSLLAKGPPGHPCGSLLPALLRACSTNKVVT